MILIADIREDHPYGRLSDSCSSLLSAEHLESMNSSSATLTRFLLRASLTLAAIACASAPPAGTPPTSDRVLATSDQGVFRDYDQGSHNLVHIAASPDSVFSLLHAVYGELGVEVKLLNRETGEIGNRAFTKYYRLGGVELHKYVGCGTTMTGPGADSYRVQMSLVSYVARDGTGSTVQTQLSARADDPGSSKGWLSCLSTGALEERVNRTVAAIVQAPQR